MKPPEREPIQILQLGPWLGHELRAALSAPFLVHTLFDAPDPDAVVERCARDVRVLVCHSGGPRTDRALLDRLPRLELILNLGSGMESVDLAQAEARGVPVMNNAGFNAGDVAELAMGMVLALGRGLIASDHHVRTLGWPVGGPATMHRIAGKRMGILGMGAIGQHIARRAVAFDMDVIYFSRRPVLEVPWTFEPDLLKLARSADYLVSALPGGEATRHLVNASVLDALGPGGFLVSVGRGTVVDERALIEALEHKRIAGAGLDVFEHEPHVPDALIASTRTILLPHCGGATFEAYGGIVQETVRRLHHHFAVRPDSDAVG